MFRCHLFVYCCIWVTEVFVEVASKLSGWFNSRYEYVMSTVCLNAKKQLRQKLVYGM